MRTRIFTDREREILKWWLGLSSKRPEGRPEVIWHNVRTLRYRIRRYRQLLEDVKLYLLAWKMMKEEARVFSRARLPISERLKDSPV